MGMLLPFSAEPSSGVPIYRQLISQIAAIVAGGQLAAGEFLPSVRTVAEGLAINPMTVSKAYSQLEADGVVERVRGKGMRVCATARGSLAARKATLRPDADAVAHRARQLDLSDDEAISVVRAALRKASPPNQSGGRRGGV
ncbi:MAG: GntR family transcriptional regulator [Pirellulales bacterium]|jgi:GntR family transcriptional regulator